MWLFIFALLTLLPVVARSEVPALDYLFPSGGKQGTQLTVSAGGKLDPWPLEVWSDSPDLRFIAETNKGTFRVEISTNAPLGAHLVRFYNKDGASAPRLFVVSCWEEIQETNSLHIQDLPKTPVVVNGRLEKRDDSDSYKVRLKKGQTLVAALDGYRFDSPIDPVLQLLDKHGTQVALSHDRHKLDPKLAFTAPEDGEYTLQVFGFAYPPRAEVSFTGSDAAVYRLAVTTGPFADYAFPPMIQRGSANSVLLTGWNLGANGRHRVHEIPAETCEGDLSTVPIPGFGPTPLQLPISDLSESREIEPNDSSDVAQSVSIPSAMNGSIGSEGDIDRFKFEAKAKQRYRFSVKSSEFDFPLDPVLTVENAEGKELSKNDDADRKADSQLDWTAPADGQFFVHISDLLGRGGPNFIYRLQFSLPSAGFRASAETHTIRVEPGKTAELKLTVTRLDDFKGTIVVVAHDLPEGITATSAEAPDKSGDVKVTFTAASEAKPANQPIRVVAVAADVKAPQIQPAVVAIKGQNAAAGHLLINETSQIWMTVLEKPEIEDAKEP